MFAFRGWRSPSPPGRRLLQTEAFWGRQTSSVKNDHSSLFYYLLAFSPGCPGTVPSHFYFHFCLSGEPLPLFCYIIIFVTFRLVPFRGLP